MALYLQLCQWLYDLQDLNYHNLYGIIVRCQIYSLKNLITLKFEKFNEQKQANVMYNFSYVNTFCSKF